MRISRNGRVQRAISDTLSVKTMASDHHPPDDGRANKRSDTDDLLLVDAEKVFHMHQTTKNNTGRTSPSDAAYELRQSLIQRNLAFLHEPHHSEQVGDEDSGGPMICDLRHESLNQILKQSIEIEKPSKFAGDAGDEDDTNNNHRDLLLGDLDQHHHQQHHLQQHQEHHQIHGSSDSELERVSIIKQSVDDRFAELMGEEVDLEGVKVCV